LGGQVLKIGLFDRYGVLFSVDFELFWTAVALVNILSYRNKAEFLLSRWPFLKWPFV
jgi:hypothetical protein